MTMIWAEGLAKGITATLENQGLSRYVKRVWSFKDRSLVIDFTHKRIDFGFDITPNALGDYLLALNQRGKLGGAFSAVPGVERRHVLAEAVGAEQTAEMLIRQLRTTLARIDAFRDGRAVPAPVPDRPNVGILTLPLSKNYGGNLQAFALMHVLRDMGCNPVLINRRYAVEARKSATAIAPITNKIEIRTPCENISFIEKHILPISRPFYSSKQLKQHLGEYKLSAVVSGSDQVWRPKYARGLLSDFFHAYLDPDDRSIRRISYAASFGSDSWDYDEAQTIAAAERLKRFDAVSVREDSAVSMCRDYLDVAADHVLDPTMLLEPARYASVIADRIAKESQSRLTTYILDQSPEKMSLVTRVAERLGLFAASTAKQHPLDGKAEAKSSVESWLAAFWNADFVFTDSFHGVAFSILFNKPFIAFGNPKRGIARFTSVLRAFGLEDRLVIEAGSANIEAMLRPIDWAAVNERMAALRKTSKQFLSEALGRRGLTEPNTKPIFEMAERSRPEPKNDMSKEDLAEIGKLCTGCGICVSESQGGLKMAWDRDGFWKPQATGLPVPATIRRVCPFNPMPEPAVLDEDAIGQIVHPDAPQYHARGGRFENTYIGYSKEHRPGSSSGGIATYVFEELLKRGEIQRLFIVRGDEEGGYHYRVFENGEKIDVISKTRYFPVTLEKLFEVIESTDGKIGVSGVACFIKAIRLKQQYNSLFRERVGFLVGIICGGLKSRFYTDFLAESAGVEGPYRNAEYRVKNPGGEASDYSFSVVDRNGRTGKVRMRRLGDMWGSGLFKNKACDFCTDVLTELADISLGDAWIPEYNKDGMGNSVVVTRSALADTIIRQGIETGALAMNSAPMDLVVRSQSGGVNHKLNALKFRRWFSERFTDLPIPACRTRHEKEVSAAEILVQILRERVRNNSLRMWRESGNLRTYNKRMRASRERLGAVTAARKKQPREVYEMLVAGLSSTPSGSGVAEIAAIHPLVRWVRRKIHTGELDIGLLLPLLPEEQTRFSLPLPRKEALEYLPAP